MKFRNGLANFVFVAFTSSTSFFLKPQNTLSFPRQVMVLYFLFCFLPYAWAYILFLFALLGTCWHSAENLAPSLMLLCQVNMENIRHPLFATLVADVCASSWKHPNNTWCKHFLAPFHQLHWMPLMCCKMKCSNEHAAASILQICTVQLHIAS